MTNPLANQAGAEAPAYRGAAVTPSDATVLDPTTRALWIGTTGDLAVRTIGGDTITLANVQNGTLLPLAVDQVLSTGTTASDIVALW